MHRLVIIGSLDENVELVKESKRRGYYTIVCDGYPFGIARQYADKTYTIDIRDIDSVAEMCIREKADGIVGSFSDLVFEKITSIASMARLKWYASPEMLKYYRDKTEAKKLMKKAGIPVPTNRLINADFTDKDVSGLQFPLVIKPNSGWGSKGVRVIDDLIQLREYFHDEPVSPDGYIVEEYMEGKEHNAICWVIDGEVNVISIGDRNKNPRIGQNIPMLNRVVYPSNVLSELYPHVKSALQKFVNETGQKSGPLCMQFFYNGKGIQVCEIAGRILGHEHPMISRYSGISIVDLLLDMTYEPEQIKKKFENYRLPTINPCAGLYFMCKNGSKVGDYSAVLDMAKEKCVFSEIIYYNSGEIIDNAGYRSYFAKFFITETDREHLDNTTSNLFYRFKVYSENGEDITYHFLLER